MVSDEVDHRIFFEAFCVKMKNMRWLALILHLFLQMGFLCHCGAGARALPP